MRNQVVTAALTGVLALGVMGCGQQAQPQTEAAQPTETKTEQVEQKINWASAKDAEAAAKGAGLDKLDRDDIEKVGGREQNLSIFANTTYNLTDAFSLGFEYLHVQTDYLVGGTATVKEAYLNRYQLSATYGF